TISSRSLVTGRIRSANPQEQRRGHNDKGRSDPVSGGAGDDQEGGGRDGGFALRHHGQDHQEGWALLLSRLRHLDGARSQGADGPQPADRRADQDQGFAHGRLQAGQGTEGRPVRRYLPALSDAGADGAPAGGCRSETETASSSTNVAAALKL